jgi:hypothetical protein
VEVDFLLPKRKGLTTTAERNYLHVEDSTVEVATRGNIGDGEDEVINAGDLHIVTIL